MAFIELIGCPASGKSTIYKELKSKYYDDPLWEFSKDIGGSKRKGVLDLIKNKLKLTKVNKGISIGKSMMISAEKYAHQHEELMENIWDLINNSIYDYRGIHQGIRISNSIYGSIVRHSFLSEKHLNQKIIIDEGILHRLTNLYDKKNEKKIIKILRELNYPNAIIMCSSPVQIIFERAKARSSVMYSYKTNDLHILNETKRKVTGAEFIYNYYKNKNIPVFQIDTSSNSVKVSSHKVLDFIDTLNV